MKKNNDVKSKLIKGGIHDDKVRYPQSAFA